MPGIAKNDEQKAGAQRTQRRYRGDTEAGNQKIKILSSQKAAT
jgi:hypothetical protein